MQAALSSTTLMTDKEVPHNNDAAAQASIEPGDVQVTEQLAEIALAQLSPEPAIGDVSDVASGETVEPAEMGETAEALTMTETWSTDALPGEVLATRRAELRWSLEEAAERLKLTPRQVSALEANDFASLPGMSSVRGFVRAYAKALGLDPQPLLALLAGEPNPAHGPMVLRRPLPTKGFPGRRSVPPPRRSSWLSRLVIAMVLIAAVVGAGVEAHRSGWLPAAALDSLSAELSLPSLPELPQLPQLPTLPKLPQLPQFGSSPAASAETSEGTAAGGDAETTTDSAAAATSASASDAGTQPQKPVANAAPALQIKLSEDAWVEITTISGNRIVSRLMKGGTSESFDIPEPAVLVVGNASAVEARLRGQLLNLKAVARDNVSKLSIK